MSAVEITSEAVGEALRIAVSHGNTLKLLSTDWKPKQVAFMLDPLGQEVRAEILRHLPQLDHVITEPTPHNPGTENFIDRVADVVIAFPAEGETRRWF